MKPLRYAQYSQLNLAFWILVCTVLAPQFFLSFDQGGISNYGVIPLTIAPYSLGFLGCSYFMYRCARALPAGIQQGNRLRFVIKLVAIFFLLMLISTYTYQLTPMLSHMHQTISITTVIFQLAVGAWFVDLSGKDRVSIGFFITQSLGFFIGLLTFFAVINLLFIAQITIGIGFGGLFIHTIRKFYMPE